MSLEKGQETLRLRVYGCYAWGGPFLVAGLAALLDYLPPQPQYTYLRPRFGEKQCWFYGKSSVPHHPGRIPRHFRVNCPADVQTRPARPFNFLHVKLLRITRRQIYISRATTGAVIFRQS